MRGLRLFIMLVCVAAIVAFSQTGNNQSTPPSGGQAARPADPNAGKTTDEAFKNIQSLKGVPADELIPAMQYFNAALGVDCNYCHVVRPTRAFEKDDKEEKKTARLMIAMTQAINKDNFKGNVEVGCATCHGGRANPTAVPPIGDQQSSAVQKTENGIALSAGQPPPGGFRHH